MKILLIDPNNSIAQKLLEMDLPDSTLDYDTVPPPISDKIIERAQFCITIAESMGADPQRLQAIKRKKEKVICQQQEIKMLVSDMNVIIAHTGAGKATYNIAHFYHDAQAGLMLLNTKFIVISDDMDGARLNNGLTAKEFALQNHLPYWQTDGDIDDLVALINAE